MRGWQRGTQVLVFCVFMAQPLRSFGEAAPVFLDGFFTDWTGAVEHVDPAGDNGSSGIDFRDVDLANDGDNLFLRFQIGVERGLQVTNNIELYLDTDLNASTGLVVGNIGAELQWQFGALVGRFYRSNGTNVQIRQDDLRLRQLPSITSTVFEVSIGRDVRPDGTNSLFPGTSMRVVLRDVGASGDRAPNTGLTLTYTFDTTPVLPPDPISLARVNSTDVRVVTWNVRDIEGTTNGFNSMVTPSADRIFSALDPQIVSFQEIYNATPAQTAALLESFLPSGVGQAWHAAEVNDCIVVSRFPILSQWAIDLNLAVLLDADVVLDHDILLVDAHLPCCTNDVGRQDEADAIMAFFRDAMTAGGTVTVPNGTLFMITGDLNLVGFAQQLVTLQSGDIVDNGTFGPDFAPDWDGTALADVVSSQTEHRFAYTWRSDGSTFAPGRLDFVIHSDSAVRLERHFSLYTPEMSPAQLAAFGLQANDVTTVSDHLPHVADFRRLWTSAAEDVTGRSGGVSITSLSSSARGSVRFAVTLEQPAHLRVQVFDVRGALVTTLHDDGPGVSAAGDRVFAWDGGSGQGTVAASGTYFVRIVAAPLAAGVRAQSAAAKVVLLK